MTPDRDADANPTFPQERIARTTRADALQRKIGFELEVGGVISTRHGLLGPKRLKKTDEIVRGTGFKLEADEADGVAGMAINPAWNDWYSDVEFVTDAFTVDQAGFTALSQTLTEIVALTNALRGVAPATDVRANTLGVGTGKKDVYLRHNGVFIGTPQCTVGLRLTSLDQLFADVSANAAANNAKTILGGGLAAGSLGKPDVNPAPGIASISAARGAADGVLAALAASQPGGPASPFLSPAVRALFTQLIHYLVEGFSGVPGYGKTIGGAFMQRTDFAATFNELPPRVSTFFQKRPTLFAQIVCQAAKSIAGPPKAGWPAWSDTGPVFSGGLYHSALMYGTSPKFQTNVLPDLARDKWLIGIAQGTDLLTAKRYPAIGQKKEKRKEIESLGSYGSNMDTLPGPAPTSLPLVELRGIPPIYVGIFPQLALDLFEYVYLLNTGNAAGLPGGTVGLTDNQRADLAMNTGTAAAELTTMLANAQNTVTAWGGGSGG